jgi:hypothetical protein
VRNVINCFCLVLDVAFAANGVRAGRMQQRMMKSCHWLTVLPSG